MLGRNAYCDGIKVSFRDVGSGSGLLASIKREHHFQDTDAMKTLSAVAAATLVRAQELEHLQGGIDQKVARNHAVVLATKEIPECGRLDREAINRFATSSANPLDPIFAVINKHFPLIMGSDAASREAALGPTARKILKAFTT